MGRITSKEAEKYLIYEYDPNIYDSLEEFIKAQKSFKKAVMKRGIPGNEDYNEHTYLSERQMYESKKLFDKAVIKFGIPLWKGKAWLDDNCKSKCPFGDECSKELNSIDLNKYCYGQIYLDIPYPLPEKIKNNILVNMSFIMYTFGFVYTDLSEDKIIGDHLIPFL